MKNHCVSAVSLFFLLFLGLFVSAGAQTTGPDVVVRPQPDSVYGLSRVSVAYDGTIYVGRMVRTDNASFYRNWEVVKSTDKGITFTLFARGYLSTLSRFTAFDLKATGDSPENFRLYVVRSYKNDEGLNLLGFSYFDIDGTSHQLFLDQSTFTLNADRGYISLSLASDTRSMSGQYPVSCVSVTASKAGSPNDSIIVWTSFNGFATHQRRGLYATPQFIRTVSTSMGVCISSPYPRLGVCWDEFDNGTAPWGDLKVMYLYGDDGTSIGNEGPYLINSAPDIAGNPTISMSTFIEGSPNPGGLDYRTIVVAESDNGISGVNLYAAINDKLLGGTPDFNVFSIVSEAEGHQVNPNLAYDVINDKFLLTYYDDFTRALVYKEKPLNSPAGDPFSTKIANYRNASNGMYNPFPRVDMGTVANGAVFVWNANDTTLFDAEISYVSIQESPLGFGRLGLYPNPLQTQTTLAFAANSADNLQLRVMDITGQTVHTQTVPATAGDNQITVNLPQLASGQYVMWIRGQRHNGSLSFIVSQ